MQKTLSLFVALLALTGAAYALPSCTGPFGGAGGIALTGCSIGSVDFNNFASTFTSTNNGGDLTNASVNVTALSGPNMVGLLFSPTAATFTASTNGSVNGAKNDIKIGYKFNWMGGGSNPYDLVQFQVNSLTFVTGDPPAGGNVSNLNSLKSIYNWDTTGNFSSFPIFRTANGSFKEPLSPGSMGIGGASYFGASDNVTLWAYTNTLAASTSIASFGNEFSYRPPDNGIPEPMSFVLLGSGLLAFGLLRRKSA